MAKQGSGGPTHLIQSIFRRLNTLPRLKHRVVTRPVLDLSGLKPEARDVRAGPISIIDCSGEGARRIEDMLAAPGTITVYVGRQGSRRLAMVREAARKGGAAAVAAARTLRRDLSSRRRASMARALEFLGRSPVYGEIHLGYRSLATYIVTVYPDDVAVLTFPYNGGRLPLSGFVLVERSRPNTNVRLDAVAIRNAPPLTKTERTALELLPATQLELNVGRIGLGADATFEAVLETLTEITPEMTPEVTPEVTPATPVTEVVVPVAAATLVTAVVYTALEDAVQEPAEIVVNGEGDVQDIGQDTYIIVGPDVGPGDAGPGDIGDIGPGDAGAGDAGAGDAGAGDAGAGDAGAGDAGAGDAGAGDAGAGDAGAGDAGAGDAGAGDAGAGDAGGGGGGGEILGGTVVRPAVGVFSDVHLTDGQIQQLGPTASAKMLLELRRRLLKNTLRNPSLDRRPQQ